MTFYSKYINIEVIDELNRLNANDEVRMLADLQWFARMDRNSQLDEMRAEGLELGRKEGRKEGRNEEKINIARKMLELNLDIETIINATGLSKEQIDELNT